MTDLPEGWEWTTVGEIGEYVNGRGFKKAEWSDTGRPIIRIQNLTGSSNTVNHYRGDVDARHVVRGGDLLVSWAATLGVYVWRGPEAVLNQHIFKVQSYIDAAFHRHLLSHVLGDLQRQAHGSGMVHITKGRFDSTPVPLPPLAEQKRIVAAIEEHLSRLDAADAALESAQHRSARIPQRIIDDALDGDPQPLGSLLREPLRNGVSALAKADGSVRVVTLTAVTRCEFTNEHTKLIDPGGRHVDDVWMQAGDIFIQRSNTPELVGTASVYWGDSNWAIFPDLLIRVRVDDAVDPAYLDLVLRSSRLRSYFQRSARGIAGSMPKISQPTVEAAPIPLPRLERQREIVGQVSQQLDAIRRLDADLGLARSQQRALRRSVLAAAFAGSLVPQHPNDEPASVLLERIRAEQARSKPSKRRRGSVDRPVRASR